jgi:hypothetical protein
VRPEGQDGPPKPLSPRPPNQSKVHFKLHA